MTEHAIVDTFHRMYHACTCGAEVPAGTMPEHRAEHGSGVIMTDFDTAGETMLGRRLEKRRHAGILHFVPGQEQIDIVPDEDPNCPVLQRGYVDKLGNARMEIWGKLEGHWLLIWARMAGQLYYSRLDEPEEHGPSPELAKRLDDALNS